MPRASKAQSPALWHPKSCRRFPSDNERLPPVARTSPPTTPTSKSTNSLRAHLALSSSRLLKKRVASPPTPHACLRWTALVTGRPQHAGIARGRRIALALRAPPDCTSHTISPTQIASIASTMDIAEADKLVKQLATGFETLQEEYQKLFGRHEALERKLATARDQVRHALQHHHATPHLQLHDEQTLALELQLLTRAETDTTLAISDLATHSSLHNKHCSRITLY